MPYRRLPNTDVGRIRTLETLHSQLLAHPQKIQSKRICAHVVHSKILEFKNIHSTYRHHDKMQNSTSQKLQKVFRETRMYVSHFIQVLRLCIIRGEIKKELKALYGLSMLNEALPEMHTYEQVLEWSERIIAGENLRKMQGGTPLYNPSIANINVLYSQLKELYRSSQTHKNTTLLYQNQIKEKRIEVNTFIQQAWNIIELEFAHLQGEDFINTCRQWGITYYLRKNEKNNQPPTL